MNKKTKTIAFIGLCTSLALVFAYLEAIIPPLFPSLPGVKMGLPNIIIIFLLYRFGPKTAITVSLLRIVLVTALFGNAMAMLYSLAGGMLSILIMIVLKKFNILSTVGVSIAGGVSHNVGQIIVAMFVLETTQLAYYLVVLTFSGIVSGVFIGLAGSVLIKKIPEKLYFTGK